MQQSETGFLRGSGTVTVLGVDPGFASMGMAVLRLEEGADLPRCLHLQVVETKGTAKKLRRNLRVAADDLRRTRGLQEALAQVIEQHEPYALAYEVYQPFRAQGGNAWKAARAEGLVQGIGMDRGLHVMGFLPMDLKIQIVGKKTASKTEVAEALRIKIAHFGDRLDVFPSTKQEHVSDAAGHALLALEELISMRKMLGVA